MITLDGWACAFGHGHALEYHGHVHGLAQYPIHLYIWCVVIFNEMKGGVQEDNIKHVRRVAFSFKWGGAFSSNNFVAWEINSHGMAVVAPCATVVGLLRPMPRPRPMPPDMTSC